MQFSGTSEHSDEAENNVRGKPQSPPRTRPAWVLAHQRPERGLELQQSHWKTLVQEPSEGRIDQVVRADALQELDTCPAELMPGIRAGKEG